MDNPLISVIIPVYKVESYLPQCLDSVINQTYKKLEIILVDDGSPDRCGVICDEYAAQDSRIIVIHKENGGVSSARNAGLSAATGVWIGFVDGDDWVEADMFEYLLSLAQKHNADAAQCGFTLEEDAGGIEMFCAPKETCLSGSAEQYAAGVWSQIGNSTCNKLYYAEHLNQIIYDSECSMGEDLLFNLYYLLKVTRFVLGDKVKYHYRQHSESACHVPQNAAVIRSHRRVLALGARLFSANTAGRVWLEKERLKMDMHNCSQMVQFPETGALQLKDEIQSDLRKETGRILAATYLSIKDKSKLLLIAWVWELYRILLLASKKEKGRL